MTHMDGRVAIVTGAGKGIGREICMYCARNGMKVVAAARSLNDIEQVVAEIKEAGAQAMAVEVDVRKSEEADALVARTIEQYGTIDVLVNNAGVGTFLPVVEMGDEIWNRQIETNLSGMFYCTRAVLKAMLSDSGQTIRHIINIASLASTNGFPGGAAYCASKFGVIGFSESLMLEVRDQNIKVTAILPGSVNTFFGDTDPEEESWKLHPEDVAKVVIDVMNSSIQSMVSRVELRPAKPKK